MGSFNARAWARARRARTRSDGPDDDADELDVPDGGISRRRWRGAGRNTESSSDVS